MTDWNVRRWTRYGHDRLYAETPGGTALGYLDLKTGRYHSDDLSNLPILEKAIGDHLASRQLEGLATPTPTPIPTPQDPSAGSASDSVEAAQTTPPPSPPDWQDLSGTQAGAAARERALAERDAQGRVRGALARLVGAKTEERAWRIGADGEQAVAAELAKLGPAWRVLHAVRVGDRGSDIDHVVVGPVGVVTVNTKHHPHASVWVGGETFMVNGQRVPYIRNSRHEARRAVRLLSEQAGFPVAVIGVIAVMGAHKGFTVKKQPEDGAVIVVARKRLTRVLQHLPSRLSTREVDAIYEVARRSSTWR